MRKQKQALKSKHYQLRWNVFHAVETVEQYEAQTGDKSGVLPYPVLAKIYQGNLMPALQFGTIVNHQTYGVTFFAKIKKDSGEEGLVERGFRIDTPMNLGKNFLPNCKKATTSTVVQQVNLFGWFKN